MSYPYRRHFLSLILLAAVLLTSACSRSWVPYGALQPTPPSPDPGIFDTGLPAGAVAATSQPPTLTARPAVDAACLEGAWQVVDLSRAMADSYAQSESTLLLQQVEGAANYEFSADGLMKITYAQLAATFSGTLDERPVSVRQSIDGSATAKYQIDPVETQLILSDFGDSGILFSLAINQQVLVEGDLPIWQAFTSAISTGESGQPALVVQSARVSVNCQGDSLNIQAVDPVPGPQIELRRMK